MDIRFAESELRFFRDNGFLIKRKVLNQDLVAQALDVFWENVPLPMERDNPDTWYGPFREEYKIVEGLSRRGGFRWNFREIGTEPYMMKLVPEDPNIVGMASQLLGPDLSPPKRVRVYTPHCRTGTRRLLNTICMLTSILLTWELWRISELLALWAEDLEFGPQVIAGSIPDTKLVTKGTGQRNTWKSNLSLRHSLP